jgi:hypothetical protein
MPKRPEIGPTVGKVTYIHGGVPRGEVLLQTMAQQQRTTLEQLEAAEQHPDVLFPYVPMPDAPSVLGYGSVRTIYGTGISPVGPYSIAADDPDVTVVGYLGTSVPDPDDLHDWSEANELDIWAPDQNPAPDQLPPVDFHAIVMVGLILLIMTFLGVGIINLFPTTVFAEFLPRISLPR